MLFKGGYIGYVLYEVYGLGFRVFSAGDVGVTCPSRAEQVHCFRGCHGENPAVLVPAAESFQEDQGGCSQSGF